MLRKGIALAVGAVDYVNEGLQKIDGVIIISHSNKQMPYWCKAFVADCGCSNKMYFIFLKEFLLKLVFLWQKQRKRYLFRGVIEIKFLFVLRNQSREVSKE